MVEKMEVVGLAPIPVKKIERKAKEVMREEETSEKVDVEKMLNVVEEVQEEIAQAKEEEPIDPKPIVKEEPKPAEPKDPEPTPKVKLTDLPKMILVKGGSFQMGSEDGASNEKPLHEVKVSDFYLAQTEVTNKQFTAFLNAKGNQEEGGVTWYNSDGAGYSGLAAAAIYQGAGDLWEVRKGKEKPTG